MSERSEGVGCPACLLPQEEEKRELPCPPTPWPVHQGHESPEEVRPKLSCLGGPLVLSSCLYPFLFYPATMTVAQADRYSTQTTHCPQLQLSGVLRILARVAEVRQGSSEGNESNCLLLGKERPGGGDRACPWRLGEGIERAKAGFLAPGLCRSMLVWPETLRSRFGPRFWIQHVSQTVHRVPLLGQPLRTTHPHSRPPFWHQPALSLPLSTFRADLFIPSSPRLSLRIFPRTKKRPGTKSSYPSCITRKVVHRLAWARTLRGHICQTVTNHS